MLVVKQEMTTTRKRYGRRMKKKKKNLTVVLFSDVELKDGKREKIFLLRRSAFLGSHFFSFSFFSFSQPVVFVPLDIRVFQQRTFITVKIHVCNKSADTQIKCAVGDRLLLFSINKTRRKKRLRFVGESIQLDEEESFSLSLSRLIN